MAVLPGVAPPRWRALDGRTGSSAHRLIGSPALLVLPSALPPAALPPPAAACCASLQAEHIFTNVRSPPEDGVKKEFVVRASYLEVHKGKLYDLLYSPEENDGKPPPRLMVKGGQAKKVAIGSKGKRTGRGAYVEGISEKIVDSQTTCENLIREGAARVRGGPCRSA